MTEEVLFAWSGGKDSALALHEVMTLSQYRPAALLTTLTREYDRVSMHGVRSELLDRQVESLRLPVEKVWIEPGSSNEAYEAAMAAALQKYRARGIDSVAFGDIFLEDVRQYRDRNLGKLGMHGLYPLWGCSTTELARRFMDLGFKAIVTCVDGSYLGSEFAGRLFDQKFLADLPEGVDPCGENGEFHSFVFAGPLFRESVEFSKGGVVLREGRFLFCDLAAVRQDS